MAKVLIVLTSHTALGSTGRPTGFYFEELATPYWTLADADYEIELASMGGGQGVHDPSSLKADESQQPASVRRFRGDPTSMSMLSRTRRIRDIDPREYVAVFLPGGHGTMWDLPTSEALAQAIGNIYDAGGIVGAVCHGPAGLVNVKRGDGRPLAQGLRVSSFTDAEEDAVGLTNVVPFLLETRLRELGGRFEAAPNFTEKAVRDGRLITGQNPMSSSAVAALMKDALAVVTHASNG